jgi:inosine/xanthosine triphosphate pyrophosphatase family protein
VKVKRKLSEIFLDIVTSTDLCRYAEMDKAVKNKISHRFKALEKLKAWLQQEG